MGGDSVGGKYELLNCLSWEDRRGRSKGEAMEYEAVRSDMGE